MRVPLQVDSPPKAVVRRSSKSILLVDDDVSLCLLMTAFFEHHGFKIDCVHEGSRALARALEGDLDIVILDVMLPKVDGFEILRQLRKRTTTPVIMLTARTAERDRIAALNAGADDYLVKPFGPAELLARIRAVLRRAGRDVEKPVVIKAGGLILNSSTREIRHAEGVFHATTLEFDVLERLMRSAGRPVSRDELLVILHHRQPLPWDRSLDVHISNLRRKLEAAGAASIRTIRGVGYQFAAAPQEMA